MLGVPGALVHRLLLTPDQFLEVGILLHLLKQPAVVEGIQLLDAHQDDVVDLPFAARSEQVEIHLAGAGDHARHLLRRHFVDFADDGLERAVGQLVALAVAAVPVDDAGGRGCGRRGWRRADRDDLDVVGEIVQGGRLVDNFRYRFDFPASTVQGAFLPLNIERYLYPGEYQLKVKIADSNRNAAAQSPSWTTHSISVCPALRYASNL